MAPSVHLVGGWLASVFFFTSSRSYSLRFASLAAVVILFIVSFQQGRAKIHPVIGQRALQRHASRFVQPAYRKLRFTVFQLKSDRLSDDSTLSDSQFRLFIRDAKSHETLWGLTGHAQGAVLQSNRDKNFEEALAEVVFEVQRIAGPAAADPAKN